MTIFQFVSYLEKYSIDVLCLSFVVCVLTSLVKKYALKDGLKKYITFIPFALGIAVCALYNYFAFGYEKSQFFSQALESGIKTGGLATVYYVFYEQFIRGKRAASDPRTLAVQGILESYVSVEKLETTAKIIVEIIESNGDADAQANQEDLVIKAIEENAGQTLPEPEKSVISKLIVTAVTKLEMK